MSSEDIHSRGAVVAGLEGQTCCDLREYRQLMSSSRSRSLRRLVYNDGGKRDISNGVCGGDGCRLGQWDAKDGWSSKPSSGLIIAGVGTA